MIGTYEVAGNLTSDGSNTYTYDAFGRVTATGSTTNSYNGDDVLVAQTTSGTTTRYTQDLNSGLPVILGDGTNQYLYGNPTERLLGLNGTTQTWYATDALGSLRQTVSQTGSVLGTQNYDPWGTPQSAALTPFGFTGELQQGSNVYLRARWYQPGSGSFVSRDGFAGWPEQPSSFMPYQYAYANPVLNRDPSGNDPWWNGDVEPTRTYACPPDTQDQVDRFINGPTTICDPQTGKQRPLATGTIVLPGSNWIGPAIVAAAIACAVALGHTQLITPSIPDTGGNVAPNPPAPTPPPDPQEFALRKVLGLEFDMKGMTDEEVRAYVGLTTKSKGADILGVNKTTRRWLIAESKGNHMDEAVVQLRTTADALFRTYPEAMNNFEVRIYTNEQQWNRILNDPRGLGGYKLDAHGFLGYVDAEAKQWIYENINGVKIQVLLAPK